jgi:hypothetical protein
VLAQLGRVEVREMLQFGHAELARIALEVAPDFVIGVAGSLTATLLWQAITGLMSGRPEPTTKAPPPPTTSSPTTEPPRRGVLP